MPLCKLSSTESLTMADASKLKRKSSLGAPPPVEDASPNLHQPETAPAPAVASTPPTAYTRAFDGRSHRRTHRTLQLNLKVTPQFDALLREIADRENLLLAEVLEKALFQYQETHE